MKIYIAAPYPLRDYARDVSLVLESRGHTVTSRWITADSERSDASARGDLEDIDAADLLLALHPEDWHDRGTGGRHFEMGYAWAQGKRIILIGQRTNNFHYLSAIQVVDTLYELLEDIQ